MNSTQSTDRAPQARSVILPLASGLLLVLAAVLFFEIRHGRESARRLEASRKEVANLLRRDQPALEAELRRAAQRLAQWSEAAQEALVDEQSELIARRILLARRGAAERSLREAERAAHRMRDDFTVRVEKAVAAGAGAEEFDVLQQAQLAWQEQLTELRDQFEFTEFTAASAVDRQEWLARQEAEAVQRQRQRLDEAASQRVIPTLATISSETRAANERADRLQRQVESLQAAQISTAEQILNRAVQAAQAASNQAAASAPPQPAVTVITVPSSCSSGGLTGGYGRDYAGYGSSSGYGLSLRNSYGPPYGFGAGYYGGGIYPRFGGSRFGGSFGHGPIRSHAVHSTVGFGHGSARRH